MYIYDRKKKKLSGDSFSSVDSIQSKFELFSFQDRAISSPKEVSLQKRTEELIKAREKGNLLQKTSILSENQTKQQDRPKNNFTLQRKNSNFAPTPTNSIYFQNQGDKNPILQALREKATENDRDRIQFKQNRALIQRRGNNNNNNENQVGGKEITAGVTGGLAATAGGVAAGASLAKGTAVGGGILKGFSWLGSKIGLGSLGGLGGTGLAATVGASSVGAGLLAGSGLTYAAHKLEKKGHKKKAWGLRGLQLGAGGLLTAAGILAGVGGTLGLGLTTGGIGLLAPLLLYGGYRAYKAWKKRRQNRQSQDRSDSPLTAPNLNDVTKNDLENSSLSPQVIDELKPENLENNNFLTGLSVPQNLEKMPSLSDMDKLFDSNHFKSLAGNELDPIYTNILKTLTLYHREVNQNSRYGILQNLRDLTKQWLDENYLTKQKQKQKLTHTEERKRYFIDRLSRDIDYLNDGEEPFFSTRQKQRKIQDRQKDERTMFDLNRLSPDGKFVFSVHAYIEHEDYLEFAKKRAELTKHYRIYGGYDKNKIKQEAATFAITEREKSKSKQERLDEYEIERQINELANIQGSVGHTWVSFNAYDEYNQPVLERSFGLYPNVAANQIQVRHPQMKLPGYISSPDEHQDKNLPRTKRKQYEVSLKQFERGLQKAIELRQSTPDYETSGYNCTEFAYDISQSMGVQFPKNAYMTVPKDLVRNMRIWSPNALYNEIGKEESLLEQQQQKKQKSQEAQKYAGIPRHIAEQMKQNYIPDSYIEDVREYCQTPLDLYKTREGTNIVKTVTLADIMTAINVEKFEMEDENNDRSKISYLGKSYWCVTDSYQKVENAYMEVNSIISG